LAYVQEPIAGLKGKAQVEMNIYPGEDHFLFFPSVTRFSRWWHGGVLGKTGLFLLQVDNYVAW